MKKLLGIFLIPCLSIFYGLGERYNWWDKLTGREILLECQARLSSADGYPKQYIFESQEPEKFKILEKFIEDNTKNPRVRELNAKNKKPSTITVDGGGIKLWSTPEEWPTTKRVPQQAQIMFVYAINQRTEKGMEWIEPLDDKHVFWVGSLEEFQNRLPAGNTAIHYYCSFNKSIRDIH